MQTFKYLVRHHWMALSVFVLAACVVLFFAGRVAMHELWRHDPARADFEVKPWMTARFVGMRMGVPPEMLFETLDVTGKEARRMTLAEISEERGLPLDMLQEMLSEAAVAAKADRGDRHQDRPEGREP